jgi:HSP20 family protein
MTETETKLPGGKGTEGDRSSGRVAAIREPAAGSRSPVRGFPAGSWRSPFGRSVFDVQPFWRGEIGWGKAPAVDIVDKGNAFEITAELPGMDESNIDVKFADGTLTIMGEKRDEKEEKKKEYCLSERRYGSFQRSFGVPDGIDADKIEANFKNGVLTVTLPKTPQAQRSEKKIAIKMA